MATLSEANYSLVLDFPTSQESTVIEKESTVSEQNRSHNEYTFILYQKHHSTRNSRNEEEIENSGEIEQEDEAKMSQEPLEEIEAKMGPSKFQVTMFLGSFFLYILWMSGIGLLLFPLLWYCGPKFYRNHFRYTDREIFFVIGIGGLLNSVFSLFENGKTMDMDFQRVHHFQMILICSFASAAFQANLPKKLMDLLKNNDLTNFATSRFRIDNLKTIILTDSDDLRLTELMEELQREGATEEEIEKKLEDLKDNLFQEKQVDTDFAIQSTISELNIDISFFYLTFFEKTPQNLLREVVLNADDLSLQEKENKIIRFSKIPKSEILKSISRFEYHLFLYKYFTKPNKYDNEKAHTYLVASDILCRLDDPSQGAIYVYVYFFVMLVGSLIFSYGDLRGVGGIMIYLMFIIITLSIMTPYICLSFFLYRAVNLMKSKYAYMKELEKLMSTESKFEEEKERKYPNLNILDFMSIKSWACLRKIFMHLNNEKEQATIRAISSVLVLQFLTLIVVALYYLKILGSPQTKTSKPMIIFTLNALAFLVTFFVVIYYAAQVNSQFEVHRNIIRAKKQVADTLFQLYPDFVGDDAIAPGTYIYNVGLNFLKKEFGEDLSAETKEKMREKHNTLMRTYDSVLEELDYEEIHYPVKILGLAITKTVVKSFGAVLISISTPLIKQGFTYISSLAKN